MLVNTQNKRIWWPSGKALDFSLQFKAGWIQGIFFHMPFLTLTSYTGQTL